MLQPMPNLLDRLRREKVTSHQHPERHEEPIHSKRYHKAAAKVSVLERLRRPKGAQARQDELDRRLAQRIDQTVRDGPAAIQRRLRALDGEWDFDRAVFGAGAVVALGGLALSQVTGKKRLLLAPAVMLPMMCGQALLRWSPPASVLQRFGLRSRKEIDRERIALKFLRGDLDPRDAPMDHDARVRHAMSLAG